MSQLILPPLLVEFKKCDKGVSLSACNQLPIPKYQVMNIKQ